MEATSELVGDRAIVITRTVKAPRALVWEVCTDPKHIDRWWGPNGFTNTIHRFELKPEGVWDFTMHGPNGQDFHNTCVFKRIDAPDYLEFDHLKEMHFYKAMIRFIEVEGGTRIEWTMRFDTAKELAPIRTFIERANEENMDKLQTLCKCAS